MIYFLLFLSLLILLLLSLIINIVIINIVNIVIINIVIIIVIIKPLFQYNQTNSLKTILLVKKSSSNFTNIKCNG